MPIATEERDVPALDELLAEIDATILRLDQPGATALDAMSEIKNTILPLMKDVVASVAIGFIDLQDLVDPVKLTGGEAEEIETLLKSLAESRPTDTKLQERVQLALDSLGNDDPDDEDEETDEAN